MRRSILTEKVARRGHHLVREYRVDPFTLTRVEAVMTTTVETVPAEMTLHQAATFLTSPNTTHPSFPIVDAANCVLGILDPPAVLHWRRAGTRRGTTLRELLPATTLVVAHPDEYLDAVIERMSRSGVAHMPVVSRDDGKLVGYLGWRDLMLVRAQVRAEGRERTAFYRLGRREIPPIRSDAGRDGGPDAVGFPRLEPTARGGENAADVPHHLRAPRNPRLVDLA